MLRDSLEFYDGTKLGSSDSDLDGSEEAGDENDLWRLFVALLSMAPEELYPLCSCRSGGCGEGLQVEYLILISIDHSVHVNERNDTLNDSRLSRRLRG